MYRTKAFAIIEFFSLPKGKSMNNKVFFSGVAILGFVALVSGLSYVKYYNLGNDLETNIKTLHTNLKNISGTCENKILDMAQVPAMYRDDLSAIIKSEMEGRYSGDRGQLASFIKERSLNYDSSLYTNIQNEITACANSFKSAQAHFIDNKGVYVKELGSFWGGKFLRLAGYPTINLDDYNIVVAQETDKIFKEGKRGPLQLR